MGKDNIYPPFLSDSLPLLSVPLGILTAPFSSRSSPARNPRGWRSDLGWRSGFGRQFGRLTVSYVYFHFHLSLLRVRKADSIGGFRRQWL